VRTTFDGARGNDMRDFLEFFALFLFIVVVCFFNISTGAYFLNKHSCYKKAEVYEIDYKYGYFSGCFVNHKGRWIELEKLRAVDL